MKILWILTEHPFIHIENNILNSFLLNMIKLMYSFIFQKSSNFSNHPFSFKDNCNIYKKNEVTWVISINLSFDSFSLINDLITYLFKLLITFYLLDFFFPNQIINNLPNYQIRLIHNFLDWHVYLHSIEKRSLFFYVLHNV